MAKAEGLALLLSAAKKPKGEASEAGEDMGRSARESAMRSMFSAAKSGDWSAAADAFEDMRTACDADDGEAEDEDSEE